jgi:hypothetical protein
MPADPISSLQLSRRHLLLAALAAAGAGCATTRVDATWTDPAFTGPALRRVMVLAVSRQAAVRRVFEGTFVDELGKQSVAAVASHVHLPQDGPPEREAVVKAVGDAGADGVIVTRLIARERELRRDWQPELTHMRTLQPGLGHAWVRAYEVREFEIIKAVAETSVYRVSDQLLVWSAVTTSDDPTNWESATRGFARAAVAAMKKQTVL